MGPVIDAHQHFWQLARPECRWPTPELSAIYRDFGPEDLAPLLEHSGVDSTVLVQSQPDDADTDYLLALAEDIPSVVAVVGWVDLLSPTAPERIARLAAHRKLRGLRPMLEALADPAWIVQSALAPVIEAMIEAGLSFDALVKTVHLPHLCAFAERHPDLPLVLDHAAKPDIAADERRTWLAAVEPLARLPQVYCKLSGLLTEARPDPVEEDLYPYVRDVLGLFGPERVMWGSDWPVVNLNGDYATWCNIAHRLSCRALIELYGGDSLMRGLPLLFGETARAFYRI